MNQDTRTRKQQYEEDVALVNHLQDLIGVKFAWRYQNGEVTLTSYAMREILQHVERLTRNK